VERKGDRGHEVKYAVTETETATQAVSMDFSCCRLHRRQQLQRQSIGRHRRSMNERSISTLLILACRSISLFLFLLQRLVEPHDLRMLLRHALSHVFVFFFCRRERLTSYIQLRGAGSQYLYFCTSKTSKPRTSIAARASVSSR